MDIKVCSTITTLNTIISKIDERMAYTRFGDGELLLMSGWEGKIGNSWNSPELKQEIIKAFQIKDNNYLKAITYNQPNEKGMTAKVFKQFYYQEKLKAVIDKYSTQTHYYHPTALHYQLVFFPEVFMKLIDIIRNKKVMFVAGGHLKPLVSGLNVDYFVEAPSTQAYYNKELYGKIQMNADKVDIILFGIGVATKPLIGRIWNDGYNVASLDMGSLLDAIIGFNSRSWIGETKGHLKRFNNLFNK